MKLKTKFSNKKNGNFTIIFNVLLINLKKIPFGKILENFHPINEGAVM